ncbi:BlaI/MecI/CopY family transcriptional regulator [Streptomyces sp. NPDC057052]|uniref:BlaI/MecI/CopY family transcriptional regulator n=1 Tax=Streptomyces sp. NPDC057052 TaxID=3346010 RepID=UPI00364459FC
MEQAASDLEENRRQQQDLAARIENLRQEERLLLDILSLTEDSPSVPDQAQGEGMPTPPDPTRSPGAEHTSAPRHAKQSPSRRSGKAVRRPGKETLLKDLLLGILRGHVEPRHAAELREELMSAHPERNPTPQVVRNTLEGLVAKGLIERHKQGRSVMYTVVTPDGGSTARAGQATDPATP